MEPSILATWNPEESSPWVGGDVRGILARMEPRAQAHGTLSHLHQHYPPQWEVRKGYLHGYPRLSVVSPLSDLLFLSQPFHLWLSTLWDCLCDNTVFAVWSLSSMLTGRVFPSKDCLSVIFQFLVVPQGVAHGRGSGKA